MMLGRSSSLNKTLFVLYWFLSIAATFPVHGSEDLHTETSNLETMMHLGKTNASQRERLASIYFLTSRCEEIRTLVRRGQGISSSRRMEELLCACGGKCKGRGDLAKLDRFRRLLAKTVNWGDRKLQLAWREAQHLPEARYWALKRLQNERQAFHVTKLRELRQELEGSLESLEVKMESR